MTDVLERSGELDDQSSSAPVVEKVVKLDRRMIDRVLIALGVVVAVVLAISGGLLTWGASFSNNYVFDELSSQNIFFPPAESLLEEGRDDIARFGGVQVTTGEHAQAYASFIDGHIQNIAGGQTYADLGGPERVARAAVAEAEAAGAPEAELAELRAESAQISGQRDTLFKGETLRGLLLSAYAWDTIGQIAGIAAVAAFVAAAVMALLVVLGLVHLRRVSTRS